MEYSWYSEIVKPGWAPPAWLFGPVWTGLYILIALSFGRVFWLAIKKRIPRPVVLPFILNLIFNFAFTPIQFGLQNNYLAAVDILLVLGTLIWAIKAIWPHARCVAYMQIPYLLWVAFATVLQLTITFTPANIAPTPITGPMTIDEARVIAENDCVKNIGSLTSSGYYNENSQTWWFDAEIENTQPGCNPACVVSAETGGVEINWRCTGLIIPEETSEDTR